MVKLIANRRMQYGTRQLRAGDLFDARPKDARILVLLQRADPYVAPPKRGKKAEVVTPAAEAAVEVVASPLANPLVEPAQAGDTEAD